MKRLLIATDLLFFLSSCTAGYFYFFISPIQNGHPNLPIIGVFLTALFISIATASTLLLYSPHLILRRMRHKGLTKNFLWKEVFISSLRRGVFLGVTVTALLLLNVLGQDSVINTVLIIGIFILLEIYFSRLI